MAIKIANGAGFLGDNVDAPRLLVERAEVEPFEFQGKAQRFQQNRQQVLHVVMDGFSTEPIRNDDLHLLVFRSESIQTRSREP